MHEANIQQDLIRAIKYYQNILPAGLLGYVFADYVNDEDGQGIFSFRHHFFAHGLDDDVALQILDAIQNKQYIKISIRTKAGAIREFKGKMLPLALINNIYTGRRYVAVYNHKGRSFETHRLDKIIGITIVEVSEDFRKHREMLDYHLSKSWGISINREKPLDKITMVIRVHKGEGFILDRIRREGRHGSLTELGTDLFKFKIEISDGWEAIPWIRTFIGRIESLECSNKYLEQQFWKDIRTLADLYGEVE